MPLGVEKPHDGRSVGPRIAIWSQPFCLFCGVKVATCCLKPLDVWGLLLFQLVLSWLLQASIAFPAWFSVTLIYPLILRPNLPFLIRTCLLCLGAFILTCLDPRVILPMAQDAGEMPPLHSASLGHRRGSSLTWASDPLSVPLLFRSSLFAVYFSQWFMYLISLLTYNSFWEVRERETTFLFPLLSPWHHSSEWSPNPTPCI